MIRRVKADAGFIEDVKNSGESAPDLGGETGPASLPTGKRVHGAIQREISQSQLFQEAEPLENRLAKRIKGMAGGA